MFMEVLANSVTIFTSYSRPNDNYLLDRLRYQKQFYHRHIS